MDLIASSCSLSLSGGPHMGRKTSSIAVYPINHGEGQAKLKPDTDQTTIGTKLDTLQSWQIHQTLRNFTGQFIIVAEVQPREVDQVAQLRRDRTCKSIPAEVQLREVDQVAQLRRNRSLQTFTAEAQDLQIEKVAPAPAGSFPPKLALLKCSWITLPWSSVLTPYNSPKRPSSPMGLPPLGGGLSHVHL